MSGVRQVFFPFYFWEELIATLKKKKKRSGIIPPKYFQNIAKIESHGNFCFYITYKKSLLRRNGIFSFLFTLLHLRNNCVCVCVVFSLKLSFYKLQNNTLKLRYNSLHFKLLIWLWKMINFTDLHKVKSDKVNYHWNYSELLIKTSFSD